MISIEDIAAIVADAHGTTVKRVLGRDKIRRVAVARSEIYVLAREFTEMSLPEIGRFFGRDHTTVLAGINSAEQREIESEVTRRRMNELRLSCVAVDVPVFFRHTEKPIFKSVRAK